MTAEEKIADEKYWVRKGYLKQYTYKEAWANFWRDTDEENRKKFLALPNFDSKIFFAITGINVDDNGKKQELIKKANELLEKSKEMLAQDEKM